MGDASETGFGCLGQLPSVEAIQERVNTAYDELFHYDGNGDRQPLVCTVCDEVLLVRQNVNYYPPLNKAKEGFRCLRWDAWRDVDERNPGTEAFYCFQDVDNRLRGDRAWLNDVCLSPRGVIGRKGADGRSPYGFSCCNECTRVLRQPTVQYPPLYSIVNGNEVGNPPMCLTELTAVELALVTPVKHYGYCFSFIGGRQMNLKGCMTFMKVEPRQVTRAVTQLSKIGLRSDVVILLSGKMTPDQKKAAQREVRRTKVLDAVKWLCQNHHDWIEADITTDQFEQELDMNPPTVVDRTDEVESENANVESQEVFSCYFPDGQMDERHGGFDNFQAFKDFVEEKQQHGFQPTINIDLAKEFVRGSDGDQLTRACLLQFPRGRGGMEEARLVPTDGSVEEQVDLESYLQHLTKVSQTWFQTPLFQLIAYSLISKLKLLRRSRLQVRGEHTAEALANGLNSDDIQQAINGRLQNDPSAGTVASKKLLNAVDATSKALPHTNEASKAARCTAESMQHQLGIGTIWITVSMDDENSLLMQILSAEEIDDDTDFRDLEKPELVRRREARKELRLKFPGFSAMNFEMLIPIVCEQVIGWDIRRNCATDAAGLFGICEALAIAFEEQGRKTLHAHITIWIKRFRELRKQMFFGTLEERASSARIITRYHEHIATTRLFANGGHRQEQKREQLKAFDHPCTVSIEERNLPVVVSEQHLRDLRHRRGYESSRGRFAYCMQCDYSWTYEDLVECRVRHEKKIPADRPPGFPRINGPVTEGFGEDESNSNVTRNKAASHNIPTERLLFDIIDYQKRHGALPDDNDVFCINAKYQHHLSCHVPKCFRCAGKKRHSCGPSCECRMRYPDRARSQTTIKYLLAKDGKPWFRWTGVQFKQPLVEILPRRATYDLFQNVSCPAISESKLSCNSNVSVITDGPISQYQFKYQHKGTQDDDTKDYRNVANDIKRLAGRKHDDDKKEAVRRVCRAAFAHNSTNVVGAPMAAFLTRNGSRFYFSHSFQYCPLKDLQRLLRNQPVTSEFKFDKGGNMFFENQALHYLCRPVCLEHLSPKEFYGNYTACYASDNRKRRRNEVSMTFVNDTGFFRHPSAKLDKDGNILPCRQGCKEKDTPQSIKISQWSFVDTGEFHANILNCEEDDMNSAMEHYALNVLTLLMPYRCLDDLKPTGLDTHYPFVRRLQEVYEEDEERKNANLNPWVFTDGNEQFLQNVQDTARNSMKYKIKEDDLASVTKPFQCGDKSFDTHAAEDDDEDDEEECDDVPYETLLDLLETDTPRDDTDPGAMEATLQDLNFKNIRKKGTAKCGFNKDIPTPDAPSDNAEDFVMYEYTANTSDADANQPDGGRVERNYDLKSLVELILKRTTTRTRPTVFKNNETAEAPEATGSIESIYAWANAAKLDPVQRRAFEVIISAFLITFFDDTEDDECIDSGINRLHRQHRNLRTCLSRLKGGGREMQLILLLHGPGGSGKTTVINLVKDYAMEFCGLLGHPFTSRTIVITAMSGVAATLLHGETTHSAIGLNRAKVPDDMIIAYSDSRLVIIDEVSFAAGKDIDKVQTMLCRLKEQTYKKYGGVNVVFSGDYSQLEPVGTDPIYEGAETPAFHSYINCYIELDGRHRFRDDPLWGEQMFRFRNGAPTQADIDVINQNCLVSEHHPAPKNVQVATYYNKNRDAVNTAVFEEYCAANQPVDGVFRGAIMILMDDLEMKNSTENYIRVLSNSVKRFFWTTCGECKLAGERSTGRVDPVLKLYPDCPLMLTKNKDVPNGQANGSRLFFKKAHIKVGEQPMIIRLTSGAKLRVFFASQVQHLVIQHEQTDICPRVFNVMSEGQSFKATFRLTGLEDKQESAMTGNQFAVISNTATTGHKLQGYTADSILVNDWHYAQNWVYVVLSRVRTMAGLYITKPLDKHLSKYKMPVAMTNMLKKFKETVGCNMLDDVEHDKILQLNRHVQDNHFLPRSAADAD